MSRRRASEANHRWDRLGYWASSACAVHCLAAPFLFLLLPSFAKVWAHPSSHALMALAVVPLALTVVVKGYQKHRNRWVLGAAVGGIVCVLVGSALPYLPGGEVAAASADQNCDSCCPTLVVDEAGSTRMKFPPASIVTVLGSALLVGAHFGNLSCCRSCRNSRERSSSPAEASS